MSKENENMSDAAPLATDETPDERKARERREARQAGDARANAARLVSQDIRARESAELSALLETKGIKRASDEGKALVKAFRASCHAALPSGFTISGLAPHPTRAGVYVASGVQKAQNKRGLERSFFCDVQVTFRASDRIEADSFMR